MSIITHTSQYARSAVQQGSAVAEHMFKASLNRVMLFIYSYIVIYTAGVLQKSFK